MTDRLPDVRREALDAAGLGRKQLLEAITLTGHYSMIGIILNSFEVPPFAEYAADPVPWTVTLRG
ncbi:MAG: hypothetical protein EXR27_17320 [Betaproteobacteria bacterium]|nr:hypothetical protein [Betaproteobacteria bacterium]